MNCHRCGASCAVDDNYCSNCGALLRRAGLPVPSGLQGLPVPWEEVRSGLVRGVAVLAVGTAAELLRREVVRRVTPSSVADALTRLWRTRPTRRKTEALVESVPVHLASSPEHGEGVTEVRSFFFLRRIIVRH